MEVPTYSLDAVGLHQLRDCLLQNAQGGGKTSLENLLPNRRLLPAPPQVTFFQASSCSWILPATTGWSHWHESGTLRTGFI